MVLMRLREIMPIPGLNLDHGTQAQYLWYPPATVTGRVGEMPQVSPTCNFLHMAAFPPPDHILRIATPPSLPGRERLHQKSVVSA